ncbi:hypothetical protein OG806_35555 [Streptomyces sp. NBC_00882]|uniref:hypothetical protein n=1 Tax=Streptomyces sp. NBC_00882 TaxID=2975856 RepID=UPI00386E20AD|nr:hypothetical protein OG806_07005 [Streptomyces sp. NBC_00882]WSZ34380.1 hypothetical protein OG806_35555 [Streptomyces sp. NBC_00882]
MSVTPPPPKCPACKVNRAAWTNPRVDFCYACLPGGPFTPPPCRTCGTRESYFSQGRCERCHPGAPLYLGACHGCLAWGVYRRHSWLCWTCRWWRGHYPAGTCAFCARETYVNGSGACRLCWENARRVQEPDRAINLTEANQHGQQLFLANLQYDTTGARRRRIARERHHRRLQPPSASLTLANHRQLLLFRMPPGKGVIKKRALTQDSPLLRHCDQTLRDHARLHGWSKRLVNGVAHTLKLLDALQDTPSSKIRSSDVLAAIRYGATVLSTLEVLDAVGLLEDDRTLAVERYFAQHSADLPAAMTDQLRLWFDTMLRGRSTAPRRRARNVETIHIHIVGMAPIWRAWAQQGHDSFAEITAEDVTRALPAKGSNRIFAEQGLRSLFTVLKAHRQVFTNPMRGMKATRPNVTVPLPLDTQKIRDALNSPDPACALAVALVAFHALNGRELQKLELTDIVDGRLRLGPRIIPLAAPVKTRLAAYLDHRARKWPQTINPHLFVSNKTQARTKPVSKQFPWRMLNITAQSLRDDRILQEIYATGGDVRRLCDFFDIGIDAALRYRSILDDPTPSATTARDSGTHHPT